MTDDLEALEKRLTETYETLRRAGERLDQVTGVEEVLDKTKDNVREAARELSEAAKALHTQTEEVQGGIRALGEVVDILKEASPAQVLARVKEIEQHAANIHTSQNDAEKRSEALKGEVDDLARMIEKHANDTSTGISGAHERIETVQTDVKRVEKQVLEKIELRTGRITGILVVTLLVALASAAASGILVYNVVM